MSLPFYDEDEVTIRSSKRRKLFRELETCQSDRHDDVQPVSISELICDYRERGEDVSLARSICT